MGQNDRSSGSRTLPLAELNPLSNPLLAENMGRWAEVYFTSPPERREQAVVELLRELEAERSRQDEESNRASDSRLPRTPVQAAAHTRCVACGRENPESNKYCGLCGAGLGEASAYSIFGDNESRTAFREQEYPPHTSVEQRSAEDEQIETSPQERHEAQYETQYYEESRNQSYPVPREFGRSSYGNGLSLFQTPEETGSDESMDWAYEPEPSSPYRYYIGAVLAVIILVLGYMAWHGTQASQNSHEVSAPPPAAGSDTAPAATATPSPSTSAANTAAEQPPQPPAPDASAPTSPTANVPKNPPETKSAQTQVVESTPAALVPSPAPVAQQTQPSAGNGGEELAIAERYLNGAAGQRRDNAEAAKWLWRSVAKHNAQATMLLSDLYLKGEGVSKNCDQARVLLDSAARKGIAGAGERLRNLPAFGCQ